MNETLLKERKLYLWGEIDDEKSLDIVRSMEYLVLLSREPISLYINSNGGYMDSANSIIDQMEYLENLGITVKTIVQGQAYSSAAIILIYGSVGSRFATKNSSMMLHSLLYELEFNSTEKNVKTAIFFDKQSDMMIDRLAERCQRADKEDFKRKIKEEWWMTAEEAYVEGLIDGVI